MALISSPAQETDGGFGSARAEPSKDAGHAGKGRDAWGCMWLPAGSTQSNTSFQHPSCLLQLCFPGSPLRAGIHPHSRQVKHLARCSLHMGEGSITGKGKAEQPISHPCLQHHQDTAQITWFIPAFPHRQFQHAKEIPEAAATGSKPPALSAGLNFPCVCKGKKK